ncbi:peptidase domain-containing ABC transporter [Catenovulum sp. SX2]|uniref:peptidase domain-containing ABC transporter n=1 Tax=Catenovulum sp. SX2 TaxID=3398614 RepID=UPI003F86CA04
MLNLALNPAELIRFSGKNKLPVIHQSEAAECGLACLAMIATYHKYETSLTELRLKYSISNHGCTLKDIIQISSDLKLSCRAVKLEPESLPELELPCILHWEMKHFVVLSSIKKGKCIIHDPGQGERILSMEELGKYFTGVALEVIPSPDFQPKKDTHKLKFSHFWSRLIGLKSSLLSIITLSLILQTLALASPYYLQTVVDDVLLRSDENLLTVLAIGFVLLLLIETAISFFREYVIIGLSNKLNIQMANNVFSHLIRLPMDYFSKRHMGDIVSRFGSLHDIRELITNGVVTAFLDGVMAIITLTMMFFYSAQLSLLVLAVAFIYFLIRMFFYQPLRRLTEESLATDAQENSHFMESIRAIQTIKLFQKENDRQSQWLNKLADAINRRIAINVWNVKFQTINQLLFGLENITIIYFAADLVMENAFTVGMLYAFLSYKNRFTSSAQSLIEKGIDFRMLEVHFSRLSDIVFEQKEQFHQDVTTINSATSNKSNGKVQGEIELKNLTYSYNKNAFPVLNHISFKIAAGECVAIVGPSGCGKSTLVKCLMGLLSPQHGQVLVDGVDIANNRDYRQNISGVMQDDKLLSGSLLDNISCFSSNPDPEKVKRCAQLACIDDFIQSLPMQYNTLVGEMGSSLSGGQLQRVVMARALYREPKILFMDEATSHLDPFTEQQLNQHIKELGITRVIIAHRDATINMADRVINLLDLWGENDGR